MSGFLDLAKQFTEPRFMFLTNTKHLEYPIDDSIDFEFFETSFIQTQTIESFPQHLKKYIMNLVR